MSRFRVWGFGLRCRVKDLGFQGLRGLHMSATTLASECRPIHVPKHVRVEEYKGCRLTPHNTSHRCMSKAIRTKTSTVTNKLAAEEGDLTAPAPAMTIMTTMTMSFTLTTMKMTMMMMM